MQNELCKLFWICIHEHIWSAWASVNLYHCHFYRVCGNSKPKHSLVTELDSNSGTDHRKCNFYVPLSRHPRIFFTDDQTFDHSAFDSYLCTLILCTFSISLVISAGIEAIKTQISQCYLNIWLLKNFTLTKMAVVHVAVNWCWHDTSLFYAVIWQWQKGTLRNLHLSSCKNRSTCQYTNSKQIDRTQAQKECSALAKA